MANLAHPFDPISELVLASTDSPNQRAIREIENHYHVAMIADNMQALMHHQANMLKVQLGHAAISKAGFEALSAQQAETNAFLADIGMTLDDILYTQELVLSELQGLHATVAEGFERVANELIAQRKVLETIADTLKKPYETKARELRNEADKWLKQGMKRKGQDRVEDYKDALRLLQTCTENPIGMEDYVVWFQIGWLHWKHLEDVGAAERAFYRSARLAESSGDLYYVNALRHQAYMLSSLGRDEDAYERCLRASRTTRQHAKLFDLARYAKKTGRTEEAAALLDEALVLHPPLIVAMYGESDFGT
jgi:tetratricopeptide (TPR) repeat protein